ncbi:hypothetical protein [Carnobacterium maltaromaticum]|uniref:hypothetical protein n=1 Tax=Carnobacterium maltaromaticum TaxID=2751 RepID=UPI0002DE8C5E|nr:hypothetical protein [Carnobacterium maltaromaticum]
MENNNKKMLILEINGLTEDEIQEEFTGFFQMLDEKYNGYGATVTGVTNRVVAEIKELIK